MGYVLYFRLAGGDTVLANYGISFIYIFFKNTEGGNQDQEKAGIYQRRH